jgi:IMP dehydrogenase
MTAGPTIIGEGLTFDDLLLLPAYSEVLPADVSVRTRLTERIELNIPLLSAPMDTVTESGLAIALAQEGGLGIIHRNLDVERQVREVAKVKRSENAVITDPITLEPEATIGQAREIMERHHISGFPIVRGTKVVGILTMRDLRFQKDPALRVQEVMTRSPLVTAPPDTTLEDAKGILHKNKVEKLLLVDGSFNLKGLITIKDINKLQRFPNACKDDRGRLRVGAAVGVDDDGRVDALAAEGIDVVVVDTAHGHSCNVVEAVRRIKRKHGLDVIAGNVVTAEGTRALIEAGADAVKVGIGPGSICTTRVVAGVGMPQLSAVMDCGAEAARAGKKIVSDGGIRYSGDITKAVAGGAAAVMIGSLFSGTAESPGEIVLYRGRSYKIYRGMGSLGAMARGSKERYGQGGADTLGKLVPEGVEGRVPYKGALGDFVYQLVGGLRAGMAYCGARDIASLQKNARFVRVSPAGLAEGHPHDVSITQEPPNYWVE